MPMPWASRHPLGLRVRATARPSHMTIRTAAQNTPRNRTGPLLVTKLMISKTSVLDPASIVWPTPFVQVLSIVFILSLFPFLRSRHFVHKGALRKHSRGHSLL